ncbi:hypothetical protein ACFC1R_00850 [Kitasatospora sp. NPDC056138]|uniref:hypothetical protein n=1 Tax=Kitasatospora sp. NPDC056138 TaxID=3345724 RepID=UPI0035D60B56
MVTGLTVGALAVIGLLAFQADGAQSRALAAKPSASGSSTGGGPSTAPTTGADQAPPQLPAASGTGRRVVYSLGSHAVWLVDPKKTPPVQAAFRVTPGTADPTAGDYTVYSRTATTTGTDGLRIEHVVRFAQQNGTVFGFSAAVDTPSASPAPTAPPTDPSKPRTGGIRSARTDGQTLWDFAPSGTKVVVVP